MCQDINHEIQARRPILDMIARSRDLLVHFISWPSLGLCRGHDKENKSSDGVGPQGGVCLQMSVPFVDSRRLIIMLDSADKRCVHRYSPILCLQNVFPFEDNYFVNGRWPMHVWGGPPSGHQGVREGPG